MQTPGAKEARRQGPRAGAGKNVRGSGPGEKRGKRAPATEPPKPGWALTLEGLAAMHPTQRHHHLLFGDLLEDVGADASVFPRESVELGYCMPDPRAWTQALELPVEGQKRALPRPQAEETSLLIQQQKTARAAIRLELFLPPQLKPTRIPDPLDRQERRRVETILEETAEGGIFPR
ncbi:protein LKAAEAR1 [Tupaia chinensis]|uniref:protein LKAAEAR1 n=1 Tax=Tupaia chinensis TaxID=246437 RepID=UPI0003C8FDBE|nr:protein LKAAEAR1 [Tupaia chinensis]